MHPPTPRRAAALALPSAAPVPALAAKVNPTASRSWHHIAGELQAADLNYSDMHAFSWYAGHAGYDLRGARTMFARRGLRGVEDSEQRKQ